LSLSTARPCLCSLQLWLNRVCFLLHYSCFWWFIF
jgi:hypothetical protein